MGTRFGTRHSCPQSRCARGLQLRNARNACEDGTVGHILRHRPHGGTGRVSLTFPRLPATLRPGRGPSRHLSGRPEQLSTTQTPSRGTGIPSPSPHLPKEQGHRCQTSPRGTSTPPPSRFLARPISCPVRPHLRLRPQPLTRRGPASSLTTCPRGLTSIPAPDWPFPTSHCPAVPCPPQTRRAAAGPPYARCRSRAAAQPTPLSRFPSNYSARTGLRSAPPHTRPEEQLLPTPGSHRRRRVPTLRRCLACTAAPAPPQAPHLHGRHDRSSPSPLCRRPRPTETQRRATVPSPVTCPCGRPKARACAATGLWGQWCAGGCCYWVATALGSWEVHCCAQGPLGAVGGLLYRRQ